MRNTIPNLTPFFAFGEFIPLSIENGEGILSLILGSSPSPSEMEKGIRGDEDV
jgi:hypothetical protein